MSPEDVALLKAATLGDQEAFAALVRRHQGLVRAACLRQAPNVDVDDCVQAVFLVLLRRPDSAARAHALESWLLTVARKVCSHARRTYRNRQRAELEASMQPANQAAASNAALTEMLDDCLHALPDRQREVITLHYLVGKSREEISAQLGIGVEAVHKQCQRGVERLRDSFRRRGIAVPTSCLLVVLAQEAQAAGGVHASAACISLAVPAACPAAHLTAGALATMSIATSIPVITAAAAVIALGLTALTLTGAMTSTHATAGSAGIAVSAPPAAPAEDAATPPLPARAPSAQPSGLRVPDPVRIPANPEATAPSWAAHSGVDAYGRWADFSLGDQGQIMRYIPAGTFRMGSDDHDRANGPEGGNARPAHSVTVGAFYLGEALVTQRLWTAVMGSNPSYFKGAGELPVDQVSWDDCQRFFATVNTQLPALHATFPTEAQWEYACRAGTTGDYAGDLDAMAWYDKNSGGRTHPVKLEKPNSWGLYDIYGNVTEWCADWYGPYSAAAEHDPAGPTTGAMKVFRGGCWGFSADLASSPARQCNVPSHRGYHHGLRLCIPVQAVR